MESQYRSCRATAPNQSVLCCSPRVRYGRLLTLTLTVLPRASRVVSACFQSSLSASREALSTSPLSCTLPPATTHWVGQMASVNSAAGAGSRGIQLKRTEQLSGASSTLCDSCCDADKIAEWMTASSSNHTHMDHY